MARSGQSVVLSRYLGGMKPRIPEELLERAALWDELSRRERADLGTALRGLGLSHSEIRQTIPVPKSTLSNWCRGIELSPGQLEGIRLRGHSQLGVPRDTQRRRRAELREIRRSAAERAELLSQDPLFAAGVALYWAEGAKTQSDMTLANTDPALLRLFILWVRSYLDTGVEFRLSLHLHEGNSEHEAKRFWRQSLSLPTARFTRTCIKPAGTGHRRNHLEHGVCRVRVCRSTDFWHTTMAWIEHMGDHASSTVATLAPGR